MDAHANNINNPQNVPTEENTQNPVAILFSLKANYDTENTTQNGDK